MTDLKVSAGVGMQARHRTPPLQFSSGIMAVPAIPGNIPAATWRRRAAAMPRFPASTDQRGWIMAAEDRGAFRKPIL
jgi:hypothetical protein